MLSVQICGPKPAPLRFCQEIDRNGPYNSDEEGTPLEFIFRYGDNEWCYRELTSAEPTSSESWRLLVSDEVTSARIKFGNDDCVMQIVRNADSIAFKSSTQYGNTVWYAPIEACRAAFEKLAEDCE